MPPRMQGLALFLPLFPLATPTIDGIMRPGEWTRAQVFRMADGGSVWLMRDHDDLYVAVRGLDKGYPSLCLGTPDHVEVLHASAALGDARYERQASHWRLMHPFKWTFQRQLGGSGSDRFFKSHGWLSTPSAQDNPTREFRIRMPRSAVWLGVTFLHKSDMHATFWPRTMHHGCRDLDLVKGIPESDAAFEPSSWYRLSPPKTQRLHFVPGRVRQSSEHTDAVDLRAKEPAWPALFGSWPLMFLSVL
jgi:hypothetical protein